MKAWLLDNVGDGIDKLHVTDVPDPPVPGQGQVLVDIHFAGLNPADRYLAENLYPARPKFPHILGRDAMGVVSAVGPGVASLRVGQKVTVITGEAGINQPGTFAQKLLAPAETLGSIPHGWTDEQAAAAPLVYITAYQAIAQWEDLPKTGAAVLVTGASGGVGVPSVQLAKAMGHTVIALSRSAEKSAKLRELGADLTFDPTDANWKKSLKEQLGKRRVDLAIDMIGGPLFSDLIDTLGNRGRVSCVGRLAGPVPNFNTATLFFRRIRIGGVAVHAYAVIEARTAWEEALKLLNKTGAKPIVDSVFEFARLKDAFAGLEQGPMGKVLVNVRATSTRAHPANPPSP
jgi:NADPH2:quinone reductase